MDSSQLYSLAEQYYLPVYSPRRAILDHGKGSRVWDRDGKEYIDFAAGIAVNGLGHAHPALIKALTDQAAKMWHTSNVFVSEPPLKLAQKIVETSGFATKVFFCNSGAEANEAAIKIARRYASMQGRSADQRVILTFENSFHGRTLATVTAGGQAKYRESFEPLPPGFRYATFNDLESARAAFADGAVCAVLVEPVQGEGGVTAASKEFLEGLRALCDANDALLMLDEVQCGMGRTGTLYAWQQYDLQPDVVTIAKALGAGMPIGAMLVGPKVADTMSVGTHGTTFGGNLLSTAVAYEALNLLDSDEIRENVTKQAQAIHDGLEAINNDLKCFSEYRGRGSMMGAVLTDDYAPRMTEILDRCMEKGLLALQAGPTVLRFLPPLNINDDDVAEGLQRLRESLSQ